MKHIRNLAFEGGGVRGIAYCGALQELQSQGVLKNCARFVGTSAGAISAWLSACFKDDLDQIESIQRNTNFKEFADDDWGVIRDADRLLNRFGWHKGDKFYEWAQNITKSRFGREHVTFSELFEKTGNDLIIIGCNASKGTSVKFSKDTTPHLFVERALRISMSIPVYFRAIFVPDKSVAETGEILGNPGIDKEIDTGRDIFVDGGVLDNYPIQTFDMKPYIEHRLAGEIIDEIPGRTPSAYNKSTLGFRVDSQTELNIGKINKNTDQFKAENFFVYLLGLVDLIHQFANKRHLDDYDWHRTIRINTLDVKSTEFELGKEVQNLLLEKGREATRQYLSDYNQQWLNFVGDE